MLSEQGADINAVTAEGRSALLYAASKGREKIVEYLLSKRADPNKADKLGATPLHRYNCHNPSPSPSKSESKVQVKSPSRVQV